MSSPFSFCNYCNKKGHTTSTCNAKKHGANSSYKWVPKGTNMPKVFPKQEAEEVHKPRVNHRPRTRKPALKETQTPRAQPRSTLDQRFQILMKDDPIKVGYLNLSDLCRSVSKHPTTASGTSIADARDIWQETGTSSTHWWSKIEPRSALVGTKVERSLALVKLVLSKMSIL